MDRKLVEELAKLYNLQVHNEKRCIVSDVDGKKRNATEDDVIRLFGLDVFVRATELEGVVNWKNNSKAKFELSSKWKITVKTGETFFLDDEQQEVGLNAFNIAI